MLGVTGIDWTKLWFELLWREVDCNESVFESQVTVNHLAHTSPSQVFLGVPNYE